MKSALTPVVALGVATNAAAQGISTGKGRRHEGNGRWAGLLVQRNTSGGNGLLVQGNTGGPGGSSLNVAATVPAVAATSLTGAAKKAAATAASTTPTASAGRTAAAPLVRGGGRRRAGARATTKLAMRAVATADFSQATTAAMGSDAGMKARAAASVKKKTAAPAATRSSSFHVRLTTADAASATKLFPDLLETKRVQ